MLQQKETYFGVIHGLGNDGDDDDDETFIYVLSILQDRVLMEESLVPLAVLLKVRLSAKRRALRAFSLSQKRALSAPFLSFL